MSSYGKLIAKFRKEKQMTQSQLAELLFISPQAISKWENNLSEPDLKTLHRLSEIFDKPINVFFGEETNTNKLTKEEKTKPDHSFKCSKCNKLKDERDIYRKYPAIICTSCHREEMDVIDKKNKQAKTKELRRNFKKTLIKYGSIASVIIIVLLIIALSDPETKSIDTVIASILVGVVIFSLSIDFKLLGPAAGVFTFFRRGIRMPGVIFSLSIDGLIFLILVKILFGFISILLSIILFVVGITMAAIVSIFTFIPLIIKNLRNPEYI